MNTIKDIGIVPSLWRESFGLSVIEFMQQEKVVITTNNGAQPEYLSNNETGILIPPNNSDILADAIEMKFDLI